MMGCVSARNVCISAARGLWCGLEKGLLPALGLVALKATIPVPKGKLYIKKGLLHLETTLINGIYIPLFTFFLPYILCAP
jgi:hypothetical protein